MLSQYAIAKIAIPVIAQKSIPVQHNDLHHLPSPNAITTSPTTSSTNLCTLSKLFDLSSIYTNTNFCLTDFGISRNVSPMVRCAEFATIDNLMRFQPVSCITGTHHVKKKCEFCNDQFSSAAALAVHQRYCIYRKYGLLPPK